MRDILKALAIAATFPRARQTLAAVLQRKSGRIAFWWSLSFLTNTTFMLLRDRADDLGFPRRGAELDYRLLGTLPSAWIQSHLFFVLAPSLLAWIALIIHGSWFVVPMLAAVLVSWKRSERLGSFYGWYAGLLVVTLPMFVLLPTRPPWMDSGQVTRIVALHYAAIGSDANPLAAMPSLHVALPVVLGFWFLHERWRGPGVAMLAYSVLVAFEVVLAGEHYLADVIAAVLFAAGIALVARLDYRSILAWTRSRAREVRAMGSQSLEPAAPRVHRERGQALIEFAIVARLCSSSCSQPSTLVSRSTGVWFSNTRSARALDTGLFMQTATQSKITRWMKLSR